MDSSNFKNDFLMLFYTVYLFFYLCSSQLILFCCEFCMWCFLFLTFYLLVPRLFTPYLLDFQIIFLFIATEFSTLILSLLMKKFFMPFISFLSFVCTHVGTTLSYF